MAYTPLPTVTTSELWTAANHNAYVKDNFDVGVPDIFTTAGDIVYATAANVAARLAIGTAKQYLRVNAGATAPEWAGAKYVVTIMIFTDDTVWTTSEEGYFWVPEILDGYNITDMHIACSIPSTNGLPQVQLVNVSQGWANIFSTEPTIDENEYTSMTAAAQPVVNAAFDAVNKQELLRIEIDAIGTGTAGLTVFVTFEEP